MNINEPKNLFHYTSIETLEKILSTKTILFNRLDRVNDNNEGKSLDFGNLGIYIFVSCWTDEARESIPLWQSYGDNGSGVRLRLSTEMFKFYPLESRPEIAFRADPGKTHPIKFENFHGPDYMFGPVPIEFPSQVLYTDELDKIIPKVGNDFNKNLLHLWKLGKYKRKEWRFEKEWRFMLRVIPAPPPPKVSYLEYSKTFAVLTNLQFKKREVSIKNVFLDLKENVLQNCEIMMGYRCDEMEENKVKDILKINNVDAKIVKSSLKGQIK